MNTEATSEESGRQRPLGLSRLGLNVLIFASGAAGLIYEVVWARQLTLFIGNTAIANAAVLTAFMIGLAAGSLILGRKADVISKPLRLYALLEILIGCYGATTPWLFDLLQTAYTAVAGAVGVTGAYSHLPRFAIAIIAMLIPTFLMGGTLPLLVKHFTSQPDQARKVTAKIYGINTLGATIGAFSAGFLLLPNIGITKTLLVAATFNIVVALGVYQLLAGGAFPPLAGAAKPAKRPGPETTESLKNSSWLLIGFAFSGFAALLYQVVWIHALILVIGVSIYAFSTVLTVFLGGVGLGSLLLGRFVKYKSIQQGLKVAFYLQLGVVFTAVISLSLISQLPILFVQGWSSLKHSFVLFQSYMFLLTALIILLPTIFLGALFPLVTGLWSRCTGAVGRAVGDAYGANALGTIAGSAIGGLFILGWLGIAGSLYLASIISLLVAVLFWYLSSEGKPFTYRWLPLPLYGLVLAMMVASLPGWDKTMLQAQVFRNPERYADGDIRAAMEQYMSAMNFLYYKEGIHGTISVLEWDRAGSTGKILVNNGKIDASSVGDMDTQILLGQIPMFVHSSPKEVMVIGLGSGMTAGSVIQNPKVERLDLLEISPEIVEASGYFTEDNYDVLADEKTNLIVADARNYLLATDNTYDVIISEPSHSWVTGVSNLFTREFLQQAKNRLKPKGVLVQWYHLYGVNRSSLRSLLKAVSEVFPHYTLWNKGSGDIIIVSSNEPLELDYQQKSAFFEEPAIRDDLARINILSVEQLMTTMLMSSEQVKGLLNNQQSNTDEYPVVEFNAPKSIYIPTTHDNIYMLFGELPEGEYTLPFVKMSSSDGRWLDVPFMGVALDLQNASFSEPQFRVIRTSLVDEVTNNHRLLGGMNGELVLTKPWGDIVVRTTLVNRGAPYDRIINGLLAHEIALQQTVLNGELQSGQVKVRWRTGHTGEAGQMNLVLAFYCENDTGLDNWVSLSGAYSGNADNKDDVSSALRVFVPMAKCRKNTESMN